MASATTIGSSSLNYAPPGGSVSAKAIYIPGDSSEAFAYVNVQPLHIMAKVYSYHSITNYPVSHCTADGAFRDRITINAAGRAGTTGSFSSRYHLAGGFSGWGLYPGTFTALFQIGYSLNGKSGVQIYEPGMNIIALDDDIVVESTFTYGTPFDYLSEISIDLKVTFPGGEPLAWCEANGDMTHSMTYRGILEMRDSNGNLVTNYTITSISGVDWKNGYVPDPSPVLTQAVATNDELRVFGTLQARSNETYTLSFEVPKDCPYSHPSQIIPLGERIITTDATGHYSFAYTFPTNLTLPALVRVKAIDATTNDSPWSACLSVTDAQPPIITCPTSLVFSSLNTNGTVATFSVPATDNNPSSLTVSYNPPSGSLFPLGTNTVLCTATDAAGNSSQCSFDLIVEWHPPVEWVGGNGDWDNPANWSTGVVPGPGDNVVIDRPGDLTITHASGDHAALSLVCKENFTLSGGSLSLGSGSQFDANFTFLGGTLAGSGDVTVTGTLNWTGPNTAMNGSGKTIIGPSGVLNLNLAHPSFLLVLRRVLQNDGTGNWTVGTLYMESGTLNNNGVFNINTSGSLISYGNAGINAFNNAGTFNKQGAGTVTLTSYNTPLPFSNSGTVNVQAGTLALAGGGTNTSSMQVAAGGAIALGDSYTHGAASVVNGDGALTLSSGSHSFPAGAQVAIGTLNLSGATADFTTPQTLGGLNLSGGTLTGSGDVTVTGTLNWTGQAAAMNGSGKTVIAPTGLLNLNASHPSYYFTLRRLLQIDGTANWTVGTLYMESGTINNNGVFNVNTSGGLISYGNAGVNALNNAGTFNKLGAGTVTFTSYNTPLPFNNSGMVDVQQGTLSLAGGGTNTGNVQITQGVLNVLAGGMDFPNAAALQSESGGTLQLSDGGLTGTTTNKTQFTPKGRLLIDGSGARQLEVMSRDLGNVSAGYNTNFAYGTLQLGGNVTVTLADNSDNNPGTEALYLDKLIVPAGTTLDLAGLHVYVRSVQIAGNVTGGAISSTPPELSLATGGNGSLTLSWPASYTGFVLEFTEGLTPPIDWQPVTSGITESGGIKSYSVTNDPNVPGRLYRLRLP